MAAIVEQCKQLNKQISAAVSSAFAADSAAGQQMQRYFAPVLDCLGEYYKLLSSISQLMTGASSAAAERGIQELEGRIFELNQLVKTRTAENQELRRRIDFLVDRAGYYESQLKLYQEDQLIAAYKLRDAASRISALEADNEALHRGGALFEEPERSVDYFAQICSDIPTFDALVKLHPKMQQTAPFGDILQALAARYTCIFTVSVDDNIVPVLLQDEEKLPCLSEQFGIYVFDLKARFYGHDLFAFDGCVRPFGFVNCGVKRAFLALYSSRFIYLYANDLQQLVADQCGGTEFFFVKGNQKLKYKSILIPEQAKIDWEM